MSASRFRSLGVEVVDRDRVPVPEGQPPPARAEGRRL